MRKNYWSTYFFVNILSWIVANQEMVYIVALMIFLSIEVIGRVPSVLHTPLMSGANAIHGVVIIGAIIVMGKAGEDNYLALILGFLAVILGTLNVVGGFVVTDRMLEMFKKKKNNRCRFDFVFETAVRYCADLLMRMRRQSADAYINFLNGIKHTYTLLFNRLDNFYYWIKNAIQSC